MKKFLAILFSVIFALSATTVAFASANTCPYCKETYENEAEYNKHLADCDGYFRECPYGCDADFATDDELAVHAGVCLEFKGECDYCGEVVTTKNAFDAHVAECKVKYFGIPIHKIMKFLEETDLYEKIFGGLFGLLEGLPYNKVFGTVFEYLEKGIHLGFNELA
jgi:hypothetical protein